MDAVGQRGASFLSTVANPVVGVGLASPCDLAVGQTCGASNSILSVP
jgi:hypothetical protein